MPNALRRRALLATALAGAAAPRARAAAPAKVRFLTSWFAEAEHGGFYQAKATGLYEKAGLDVEIRMGGPQVNGLQLLTAGTVDMMIGYDIQMLSAVEKGLPVTTIAAPFQIDLTGIMAHPDVPSLAALKGHKILISAASHTTFWPWLKQTYGFSDDMIGVDTFNLAPFIADKTAAMQGYASSEPYEAQRAGVPAKFFLLSDDGYPPYSTTIVTTDKMVETAPETCQAFVQASMEGWRDYVRNPAPANALIKAASPQQTDGLIAYAIKTMQDMHVLDKGLAPGASLGTMTAARWQQTRDFLVKAGVLQEAAPWRRAFTTRFTETLHIPA